MTAVTACEACGTEPLENARFCHSCGASLAESHAEYKQVTVLFADVVHSMDIAAAVGAERLREIMADLVDRAILVVERYGGTVDKFTGDGIMAVFGAPVALEDHAVRACFAALGIQTEAGQLAEAIQRDDRIEFLLRVGLNSGEVIAGQVASHAMGYTAVGEHVGLAQRMESVAPPGGVMLSESTSRLLQHAALMGQPETVRIKGSADPVTARRLLGMESRHAVVGRSESRLVGRRWEMAAVEANLERSIDGDGAAVALVGPAGIGKSRIVREVAASAAGRGADVFWAFCESHTSDIPFHAVSELLRAIVGLPDLAEDAVRERLRMRLEDADEEDLVLFEDLLGIRDPETPLPTIDPDARHRRLSALIKAAAIARDTPAVYIVEDAHWIDDVSDAMLTDVMTVLPQTHSMFLLTHRPEFRGSLTRVPGAQTLALAPLSSAESTALASELLGSNPSVVELAATITARAAGNPFFAEEIVRDLTERGVLSGRLGAYVCRQDVADISVPATLQATIAARIDRLDPRAKRTLCAATVIGMRFDIEQLTIMGVDAVVDELLAAELIDQVRFTGHAEYAFRHPLMRTVAYESQLKSDRAALHRRLAAAIEARDASADENAALIAEHLEAAGDVRTAYGWRMRAAAWLQGRDIGAAVASWDTAAALADRLPADDESRLAMRIAPRAMSCVNGWRIHVPIAGKRFDDLQDLCAAAGDKASVAVATTGLLGEHVMNNRLHEAIQLSSEYMALIESIGDPALTVGLSIVPIAGKILAGEMPEVLHWSDTVIELAEGDRTMGGYFVGSPLASAYAMRSTARWWLGQAGWRSDFDCAVAMARDADPLSQAMVVAYTYANAITCGVIAADDAAMRDIDEGLRSAERSADDLAVGLALYTKANALRKRDSADQERALELLAQLRERALDGRFYPWIVPVVDVCVAEVKMTRQNGHGVPPPRASVDELYANELLAYAIWGTDVLVQVLLRSGTRQRGSRGRSRDRPPICSACARRVRVSRPHSLEIESSPGPRSRRRDSLSRLRQPIPRFGDIAWFRGAHRDRRGDGGRGRYRTADRWCVKPELYH